MKHSFLFLTAVLASGFASSVASAGVDPVQAVAAAANSVCKTQKDCSCKTGFSASCLTGQCTCTAAELLRAESKTIERALSASSAKEGKARDVSMSGGKNMGSGSSGAKKQRN